MSRLLEYYPIKSTVNLQKFYSSTSKSDGLRMCLGKSKK